MVIASSTLTQSMNAVVTMDAIDAFDPYWSTDNSGLTLNWQGGPLTMEAVSTVETLGFTKLGNTKH